MDTRRERCGRLRNAHLLFCPGPFLVAQLGHNNDGDRRCAPPLCSIQDSLSASTTVQVAEGNRAMNLASHPVARMDFRTTNLGMPRNVIDWGSDMPRRCSSCTSSSFERPGSLTTNIVSHKGGDWSAPQRWTACVAQTLMTGVRSICMTDDRE